MSNVINGFIFEKMMNNALNNLYVHEKEINDMNVFPVADGDTGTNMRLTLENGLNHASKEKHLGKYLKGLSTGMLLGARGNSGVILSQLFRGMYLALVNKSIANPREMLNSFVKGYKVAYAAVLKPVEGTILTVTRMGIENVKPFIKGRIAMVESCRLYLEELNKALLLTPSMLPVLKEANVLDSGAKGYITIVEGMYKYLNGEIIDRDLSFDTYENNEELIIENNYEVGFHMEYSIKVNKDDFSLIEYEEKIKNLSTSFSINFEDKILMVKLNTDNPTPIITESRKLGEFISFNLDNNKLKKKEETDGIPFKAIVYIACVSGSGIKEIYKDLGVDIFLDLNPSTKDFLDAFKRCNAEKIVILPNDKNILETVYQAVKIANQKNIYILPTKNVVEGYYALAMDVPDSSVENRIEAISEDVGVECLKVSKAVKEFKNDEVDVKIGNYVAYKDSIVLASDVDSLTCLNNALHNKIEMDSKSSAFVLLGKNIKEEKEDNIASYFADTFTNIEASILRGEQEKEDLIIGLL